VSEDPVTEEVLKEIHMDFIIKYVRVATWNSKFNEIRTKIRNEKTLTEVSESFTFPEDYSVSVILKRIEKLYDLFKTARNEKLAEGAREEILNLIGLLIWRLNPPG